MKHLFSLLACISFTAFAMRHAPLRAMGTGRRPAAAKHVAQTRPVRTEFLTPKQQFWLKEIAANTHQIFTPNARKEIMEELKTLPLRKENEPYSIYDNALMTLALKSRYHTNLAEDMPIAEELVKAGANIQYSRQVQENDCFGSMDGVSERAPYTYRTEAVLGFATGDLKEYLEKCQKDQNCRSKY